MRPAERAIEIAPQQQQRVANFLRVEPTPAEVRQPTVLRVALAAAGVDVAGLLINVATAESVGAKH